GLARNHVELVEPKRLEVLRAVTESDCIFRASIVDHIGRRWKEDSMNRIHLAITVRLSGCGKIRPSVRAERERSQQTRSRQHNLVQSWIIHKCASKPDLRAESQAFSANQFLHLVLAV